MQMNYVQTCSVEGVSYCTEWTYSGRVDDIRISIPMLEAMSLITLWVLIASCVIWLVKRFT